MPDNYFRASDLHEIIEHLKLFRSFLENVSSGGRFSAGSGNPMEGRSEQGHSVVIF